MLNETVLKIAMNRPPRESTIRTLVFWLTLTAGGMAQSVTPRPPMPDDAGENSRATELSPLVISAATETGWISTETLAGSRLRTNFKDVPNQVETLTKDFLDDLALTTVEQSLMYTANVENQGDYVQSLTGLGIPKPAAGGRVRGIGVGTLSRNFFQVHNPADNFNLERSNN